MGNRVGCALPEDTVDESFPCSRTLKRALGQGAHKVPAASAEAPLWTPSFARVLATNCAVFVSYQMLVPIVPLYVVYIGGNEATTGLVVGTLTLTVLLGGPLAGWLLDRWGRQVILVASIAMFAMVGLSYPLAASPAALVVVRLMQGIGWSGMNPAVSTIVSDLAPRQRLGEALAYQSTSQSLAMAIGPATGLLVLQSAGYTPAFLASVAFGFLGLILALRIRYRYVPPAPKVNEEFRFRDLVEDSSVSPSAITALMTFLFAGLTTFVPLIAQNRDLGSPAVFFVTFAIVLVAIRPIAGRISDRQPRRGLLLLPGLGLIASCLLVLAFTHTPLTLAATGILWAVGFGVVQPILRAMVVDRAPPSRWGAANATMTTAYQLGLGLGALLLGAVASLVGLPSMFALSSLIAVAAALLVF